MDVAIVTKQANDRYGITVLKGTKSELITIGKPMLEDLENITSQPMLLDINGDMISDLLFTAIEDGVISYYVYYGKTFNKELFDPLRHKILVANQNSNTFIDLNSDGVSDIFIEGRRLSSNNCVCCSTTTLKLKLNQTFSLYSEKNAMYHYLAGKNGYTNTGEHVPRKIKYPNEYEVVGASTFCDINSDEIIEHLIPVCKKASDKKSCSIIVRDDKNDEWIELIKEIKVGDDYFYFKETASSNGKEEIKIPIRLRHGYVNENGYTDLMALMKSSKDERWHVVLFNNRKVEHKPNELSISFDINALNETINGEPILATFFDLYEDGVIDILVNYKIGDNEHEFKALTLNEFADVNFVKILVTSGLCTDGKCYEKGSYGLDTYLTPYGTNSPGSMVCYQLISSNSNAMRSCGGQLSQSSNFALQMPYTIFGLGLYANYIEKITITIPSGNTTSILSKEVRQIVPDSQIVVIPNPINDPNSWKVKLFLTPSDLIYKTLYTLTAICIVLIVLIGFLHRKEMLEDVEEQKLFKKQWPEYRR